MTYENFVVPNSYWAFVLEQKRITFINEFYKKNNYYPSKEEIANVVLTNDEMNRYKRLFYAKYYLTGNVPQDNPNTPNTPIVPPTEESGSTENPPVEDDNGVIPPSNSDTVKNVLFKITMNDIPEALGVGGNMANTVFKMGILNGDLLDMTQIDIVLKGTNGKISIKNLDEIYSIPIGEYTVSGTVGYPYTQQNNNMCHLKINETIDITNDGVCFLTGNFTCILVVSNKNFISQYKHTSGYGYASYREDSYLYNDYYYTFFVRDTDIHERNFIFDEITYGWGYDRELTSGVYYYYEI